MKKQNTQAAQASQAAAHSTAPAPAAHAGIFADPSPMGLIGLAVACASLVPFAFGFVNPTTPSGVGSLKMMSMYCLYFGAGCQFLAGMMSFANKNLYGGTLFTAFSFNWLMNYWVFSAVAEKVIPDANVVHCVEITFLLIFVVMTIGFGYLSKTFFIFLLDIDFIYALKVIHFYLPIGFFNVLIAIGTVLLGVISLWLAFAILLNPVVGKQIFKISGPMFGPLKAKK